MTSPRPTAPESWRQHEAVYDRFEQAWQEHGAGRIEEFLPPPDAPDRLTLLLELIGIDIEQRSSRGLTVQAEEYLRRFPELAHNSAALRLMIREVLPHSPPTEVRKRLGRYELREVIGRGGFATVYRAWDAELHREVAVKVPREELLQDADVRGRVMREARSAAQLRHPAIVPLHEVGQEDSALWLVYEFVAGPTLAQELRRTRPAPRQAAQWAATLADALEYAHRCGIVHRDVKPANVLMNRDGRPVLTDFGLALHAEGTTLTQQGALLGTPAYMSPEQARGLGHEADARSDVYSLGVLLYEMLSGQVPFQARGPGVLHQVIHDDPTPPRSLHGDVPVDLETICLKAMAKEPGHRYASAGALADDLRRYLEYRPIQARRIGPLGQLARWCRRRPALAATLGAALLVIAVVTGFSYRQILQERDRFRHERDRAQALAANLACDRGLVLCEQGEIGPGLLSLVRSLELAPEESEGLRRAIRFNLGAWGGRLAGPRLVLRHGHEVRALAVAERSGVVLSAGQGGAVRRWDATAGEEHLPPLPHPEAADDQLSAVCVSPDGRLAVAGGWHGNLYAWDVTARPARRWLRRLGDVLAVAHHPGKPLVLVAAGKDSAHLLDAVTGDAGAPPLSHGGVVRGVTFSGDGKLALTAGGDGVVRCWDAVSGQPDRRPALRHPRSVDVAAVSPDNRLVATGCADNQARIWDMDTCKLLIALQHRGPVTGVAFRRDGAYLLTGSADRTVRIWDVRTGLLVCPPLQHPDGVTAVALAPDGQSVLTGCQDGLVRRWSWPGAEAFGAPLVHDETVWAAAFSPDGRTVLTGSGASNREGYAQVWDVAARRPHGPRLAHPQAVRAVAISPDGGTLLTGCFDARARFWDARNHRLLAERRQPADVHLVAFSPTGGLVATGNQEEPHLTLWEAGTRQPTGLRLAHDKPVRAVAFSGDGRRALTGSYDHTARLWDLETGAVLGPELRHPGAVGAVALSPDGRRAATGADDHWGQVWDVSRGNVAGVRLPHRGTVRAVAFSPDGRLVLTGSWDHSARLWEPESGKPVGPRLTHQGEVETAAFHPDGRSFLTGGWDRRVRFWPTPTPASGSVEYLRLWVEGLSGLELDDAENPRLLDPPGWLRRFERLEALGGPPRLSAGHD